MFARDGRMLMVILVVFAATFLSNAVFASYGELLEVQLELNPGETIFLKSVFIHFLVIWGAFVIFGARIGLLWTGLSLTFIFPRLAKVIAGRRRK